LGPGVLGKSGAAGATGFREQCGTGRAYLEFLTRLLAVTRSRHRSPAVQRAIVSQSRKMWATAWATFIPMPITSRKLLETFLGRMMALGNTWRF